jgi:hypothetical protein
MLHRTEPQVKDHSSFILLTFRLGLR